MAENSQSQENAAEQRPQLPQLCLQTQSLEVDGVSTAQTEVSSGGGTVIKRAVEFPYPFDLNSSARLPKSPTLSLISSTNTSESETATLCQTVFLQATADDVPVFLRHAIEIPATGWRAPLLSWRSAEWMMKFVDVDQLELAEGLPRGNVLNDEVLVEFLTQRDWQSPYPAAKEVGQLPLELRRELLEYTIAGVLGCLMKRHQNGGGSVQTQLLINAEPDLVVLLLLGVAKVIPSELLSSLGFTTLVAGEQVRRCHGGYVQVMGTCYPGGNSMELLGVTAKDGFVVNTFAAREGVSPWFQCHARTGIDDDLKWIKALVTLASKNSPNLQRLHAHFRQSCDLNPQAFRNLCEQSLRRAAVPANRSRVECELLRSREFELWEKKWEAFLREESTLKDGAEQEEYYRVLMDQLEIAFDEQAAVPFRIRRLLIEAVNSRYQILRRLNGISNRAGKALDHFDEFFAVRNPTDVAELLVSGLDQESVGKYLVMGFETISRNQHDTKAINRLGNAIVAEILKADAKTLRAFTDSWKDPDADQPDAIRNDALHLLIEISGEDCLLFLLTLLSAGLDHGRVKGSLITRLFANEQCFACLGSSERARAAVQTVITSETVGNLIDIPMEPKVREMFWSKFADGIDRHDLLESDDGKSRITLLADLCKEPSLKIPSEVRTTVAEWCMLRRRIHGLVLPQIDTWWKSAVAVALGVTLAALGVWAGWKLHA